MSERAQRRLAAIVAADVAGYSRLVGADEEGTLSALRAHRNEIIDPLIAEHGGRVANTAGDSLLLEFPSVVDAVRCSVAVQEGIAERNGELAEDRRILFRVGINLGDVIAQGEDLLGDGVNIAARLETLSEPGGITLSDDAYRQVRDRLDIAWHDGGEHEVKNIARPVHVWRWVSGDQAAVAMPTETRGSLPLPDKPSISVLPFDNMSGDPEQEYFSDGLTEDIITELSRFQDLFVTARNSSFTFKGRAVVVQEVARQLGVQFVLEGGVRKVGNRIRVTAQLIDARNGNHIWAEKFDRDITDIFAVQDEITQNVVAVLPGRIELADRERLIRKPTENMGAYELLLKGKAAHHRETAEATTEALEALDAAIQLDPSFTLAHAWKGCTLGQGMILGFLDSTKELFGEAVTIVEKAYSMDENDIECHRMLCRIRIFQREFEQAKMHIDKAMALNPNDPRIVYQMGTTLIRLGQAEEALDWIARAIRLDPFSEGQYVRGFGWAKYLLRRYDEAINYLKRVSNPRISDHALMAACYAMLERSEDASNCLSLVNSSDPSFSVRRFLHTVPHKREKDKNLFTEGLIAAGLPK